MESGGLEGIEVAKDGLCSLFDVVRINLSLRRLDVAFARDKH